MKKQVKKLVLAKETLQNLNLELGVAVGGDTAVCFHPRQPINYTDTYC